MSEPSTIRTSLETLDPLSDPRWAELVGSAPAALIFHHPLWLRLLRDHYRCEISAWALAQAGGGLVAGLPFALMRSRLAGTRLVALPFSTTCPLLVAPAAHFRDGEFVRELASPALRGGMDLEIRAGFAAPHGAQITRTFVEHRLALDADMGTLSKRFSRSQKSSIAKAVREGVTVERRTDTDALRRFYRLHLATRRRLGLPTPSKRFILRYTDLFSAGLGFVMLAQRQGRDAAAAVFLASGGTLTYESGASDLRYLGARPNNLLFSEVIRWALESGHHTLDFGRTDADNTGLLKFKASWGATPSPLHYCRFGSPMPSPSSGRARAALSKTISHAPPVFGRLVGAGYYRHFG